MSFFSKFYDNTTDIDLIEHPVFGRIECAVQYQIDNIDISHKAKRNMVHEFLKVYFIEFQKAMVNFIKSNEDSDEVSSLSFLVLCGKTMAVINEEALAKGIPEIFLTRYNDLHSDQVKAMFTSLENVMNSRFYEGYELKMSAMLDIVLCHLVFIILDAERTLNTLNGNLEATLVGSIFD